MTNESNTSAALGALGNIAELAQKYADEKTSKEQAAKAAKAKSEESRRVAFENFPKPIDFLLTTPLYKVTKFTDELVWPVLDLLYFVGTYDCYCVQCGQSATFKGAQPVERAAGHTRMFREERIRAMQGLSPKHPVLDDVSIRLVTTKCTRVEDHRHEFLFQIRNEEDGQSIQKIGQFPSYADIHLGEVRGYSSVLSSNQRQELSKAIGLSSHGVGIGSFVYLRRIFEALVEDAHQVAIADSGWDESAYDRMRMAEKIAALKAHLPPFLSQNAVLYSILSKGIHELTEDECLEYFDTVRLSIEAILDEKIDQKRKAEKARAVQAALQAVAAKSK